MPRQGPHKAYPVRVYAFDWADDAEWQVYAQAQVNGLLMRNAWFEVGRTTRARFVVGEA